MAIQEITSPPMLDSTGQAMVTKLQSIASAINSNAGAISYDNTISGMTATKVQSAIDEVKGITDTISSSLTQLQSKMKTTSFSGTTDASGNIALQGVTSQNSFIVYVISTKGYCTMPVPSGNDLYVKVLGNTNPITPVASTSMTIYVGYFEV